MSIDGIQFHTERSGTMAFDGMIGAIINFVRKDPSRFYKIIVGTDSEARNRATLVTAVTAWRVGNGAIHFWTRSEERKFHTLRERIWQEALNSILLAQELRSRLQTELGDEFFWDGNEVHVDIGERGPTKELVDSVAGMIKGYNFLPVIKPCSFGASTVADRHT